MAVKYANLLSNGRIGDYDIPNRMIMAPMTRFRVTTEGVPEKSNALYYSQRASAGLMICESLYVEPRGIQEAVTAGIYSDEQIEGWRYVTDQVHSEGGLIFAQLAHAGRLSHPTFQPDGALPIAPSAIAEGVMSRLNDPETGEIIYAPAVTPRAMETDEVREMVQEYKRAALRARKAGFDGVEIHCGSGHLHRQFLQASTNFREDEYGGSIANRCRFLIETLEAIIPELGSGKVGVKISPNFAYNGMTGTHEETLETYEYLCNALMPFNLAYLYVQNPVWNMFFGPEDYDPIVHIREHYSNTLLGGGELDRDSGEAALASKTCDYIVFGRRFIANPDLPKRIAIDAPENAWDDETLYTPGDSGFTDYTTMDEEAAAAAAASASA
ncbi:MAG: alkene reductase [Erythrobacter sp.]